MNNKIAIIGDGDNVLAFKAVGIDAFSETNPDKVEVLIKKLAKEYKIIFITDVLAKETDDVIKRYLNSAYPVIISVPSKAGSNGYGMESLKQAMDKALGVDILFKDNKDDNKEE